MLITALQSQTFCSPGSPSQPRHARGKRQGPDPLTETISVASNSMKVILGFVHYLGSLNREYHQNKKQKHKKIARPGMKRPGPRGSQHRPRMGGATRTRIHEYKALMSWHDSQVASRGDERLGGKTLTSNVVRGPALGGSAGD